MDDFGSSLERDYGLGGRKGRTGSRNRSNSGSSNAAGSRYLRFSESFGRNKLKHESGSSYKGGWTSNSSAGGGYGGRNEFPSTYSVYDEIFSSNLHSTIPVFEDVFRVASARMKVSELRDNDVFRGMMGLRRSSSRVTYEDIFGDAPDEFSGPFLFSDAAPGSRLTASSRASSSGGQSPATAQHASQTRKDAPGGSESPIPRKDGPGGSRTHSETPSPRNIAPSAGTRSESPTPRKDAPGDVDFEAPNTHKEAPEDFTTRSESSSPRKVVVAEDLPDASAAERPPEMRNGHHHTHLKQPENTQGSFLGALKNSILEENGCVPNVERRSNSLKSRGGEDVLLEADANGDAHTSPVLVEKAWLSVTEVSLMTQPSENPPPARSAPGRASSSSKNSTDGLVFETVQVYSGPPPSRVPPPPVTSNEPVKTSEASSMPSELLARALKERSAHAEMTIREKVLDWQKHNLAHEEAEKEKQELESVKSRTDSFHKLEAERDEAERVLAEVNLAAAEQTELSAEVAVPEQTERDAGAVLLKQELPEDGRKEESATAVTRDESEGTEKLAEVRESEARTTQDDERTEDGKQDVEVGRTDVERVTGTVDANGPECEAFPSSPDGERHDEGTGANEGETTESTTLPQLQTITVPRNSTDTESTIGIDTISSASEESTVETTPGSGTAAKEGPAPETPDRVEPAHLRKSEIEADVPKKVPAGVTTRTESQQLDEEQRQRERTLVARITAEVKERAALDVKAKVERAAVERRNRRTKPRLTEHEALAKELEDSKAGSSGREGTRVSLREQLEKERQARLANERSTQVPRRKEVYNTKVAEQPVADTEAARNEARLRAERSLAERLNDEVRQRVVRAEHEAKAEKLMLERAKVEREKLEKERLEKRLERERLEREKLEKERLEKERLERIHKARERERERLEKLARERELEQQRLERELELEREIERKKDRVGLENRLEAEAEAARIKMERIAVERTTAEVRARAYERAAAAAATASRPSSVPKQRFGNSASMPSNIGAGAGHGTSNGSGMRRATSSTNLNSDRYSSSGSQEFQQEFQELKGETPERRKARLERFQRTQNRAAQALAQKNKRDLEMQSEQAERQRLSERLDAEIRRWSVGKDGNIRALLSTLQYVLWPESGWKQVSLTELINPAAVKKAYRRATLCVHPDKMQQKHATVQQKYIAEKVFHILQVAWNKFNSQEAL